LAEVEEKYDLKGIEGFVEKSSEGEDIVPKKQKKLRRDRGIE